MNEWSSSVQSALKDCREAEQKAQKEHLLWKQIIKLLPDGEQHPFALLSLIEQIRSLNSQRAASLDRIEQFLRSKAEEQLTCYRRLLEQELGKDGYVVEGSLREGYRVNKVVEVKVDDSRGSARVGTRFHTITVNDISYLAVADAVRKEMHRLFDRPLENSFIDTLFKAYTLALTEEEKSGSFGEHVRILNLHRFVAFLLQKQSVFTSPAKDKFVPYLPDEFGIDIGRLLERSATTTTSGHSLHLTPSRNPSESLFIVNFATGVGQNYSFVSFRRLKEVIP